MQQTVQTICDTLSYLYFFIITTVVCPPKLGEVQHKAEEIRRKQTSPNVAMQSVTRVNRKAIPNPSNTATTVSSPTATSRHQVGTISAVQPLRRTAGMRSPYPRTRSLSTTSLSPNTYVRGPPLAYQQKVSNAACSLSS
jgi:hypothetical protein